MARPPGVTAEYVRFAARLPQRLMECLRARSAVSGAPLNTELVRAAERGLLHTSHDDDVSLVSSGVSPKS